MSLFYRKGNGILKFSLFLYIQHRNISEWKRALRTFINLFVYLFVCVHVTSGAMLEHSFLLHIQVISLGGKFFNLLSYVVRYLMLKFKTFFKKILFHYFVSIGFFSCMHICV